MNKEIITLALVGCGNHSHAHLQAASQVEGVNIIACCDIHEDRARQMAEQYGIGVFYRDMESMLQKESPHGVILCTWPNQHLEQIKTCLTLGVKNILCEKALTLTYEDALDIEALVNNEGAFLMEGLKYLHHRALYRMEQLVNQGEIGKIDSIRASFSNYEPMDPDSPELDWRFRKECGGGVAYDWLSYLVHGANYFSGSLPRRIFASGTEQQGVINRILGMVEYDNGIVATLESSKEASFTQELQIIGSKGRLSLPIAWGISGNVTITKTHRQEPWPYILTDTYEVQEAPVFAAQLENFLSVIRGEAQPRIPLEDSILNARTIDALVQSLRERRQVELPE